MTEAPGESLPKQCASWSDLKAAYRLLSNEAVEAHAIQQPHRQQTLAACDRHPVVLCVQDTTPIDLTRQTTMRGRGQLGGGTTQGLLQHTALALVPADQKADLDQPGGQRLGLLHTRWHRRTVTAAGQTLRQLQARRTAADVWLETASAVDELGDTSARLIHVGDRHCDLFRFFAHVNQLGHGFVVRAMHDRMLPRDSSDDPSLPGRLFETLEAQPIACHQTLTIHEQRTLKGQVRCPKRSVTLAIRYAAVTLPPPKNDPRTQGVDPLRAYGLYAVEQGVTGDRTPVSWVLLTSEPVTCEADALRIIRYYRHRWVIEEWHRVLKEGCRLESAHFDDVADVQRLAAIKAVIAVRLLQLRDLADRAGDNPQALRAWVPATWIQIAAALSSCKPDDLTTRQFWLAVAKRGGYLARKHDPRPGWRAIWKGWYDIQCMAQGIQLMAQIKCG